MVWFRLNKRIKSPIPSHTKYFSSSSHPERKQEAAAAGGAAAGRSPTMYPGEGSSASVG